MNTKNNKQSKYEKALEYEIFIKEEYGFAKGKIENAECIFDVGWHIWLFTKRCRTLNSHAEIYYFEPIGEFYNQAKWNLIDDKIHLNNYGISSSSWTETLLLNPEKTMQSSKYKSFLNPNWIRIAVNFITLKDYLEQVNIPKINILKMDIEWMEFDVLDSRWEFEWWKIENLIVEIHLLNDEIKSKRNQIFSKIKNIFWNVKTINSPYRDEIFLLRAYK